ncbi:hypothetical protein K435DRAFT_715522 [Dendrothele bispora CBS 962.96]|uniref:Uncharacterized protein n=1 Tax=Dendrothele bispora (strain CBS 962.96) TaxID=1314807 RepID=A0A4S8MLU6_DENBC|nr:hypothetical protein K435DRAFT_715522 [Dendrothele bispora CBS 962.96]
MEPHLENLHMLSGRTLQLILSNAQSHSALQERLQDLRDVPSQLEEHELYLADLGRSLKNTKRNIAQYRKITEREREEHRDLSESTMRRLAYKMARREVDWETKKETKNRKYTEAFEEEMTERQSQQVLEASIGDAERLKSELVEKKDRIKSIQAEIEDLHKRVFDGARQELPRDRQLSQRLKSAQSVHYAARSRLKSNSVALSVLSPAAEKIRDSSRQAGFLELQFDGNGERRKNLNEIARRASEFEDLFRRAQSACSEIADVPRLPTRDIYRTAEYLDSSTTAGLRADVAKYRKEITHVRHLIESELRDTTRRVETAKEDLAEASKVLTSCTTELQEYRRAVFESIVASATGSIMDELQETSSTIGEIGLRNQSHDSLPSYITTRPLSETETLPSYHSLTES